VAYATLGQLDERLTEIDRSLLRASLGEVLLGAGERSALEHEGEMIARLLAQELGKHHNKPAEEIYEMRESIRQLNFIAGVGARYRELHPEPNPEHDRIIAEACEGLKNGTKTNEEVAKAIASVFDTVLVEPREVGPMPGTAWGRFWRSLREWRSK
jgi:hypothetical protein